jgi:hypothetical protein
MFGDPKQRDHMIAGVKAAHASPATPAHLRPHLEQRLRGGTMPFPPRKTTVGPLGRTPIVTRTGPMNTTPRKTIVGATARPPVKTMVGRTAAPPSKTLVGNMQRPPLKTTPANLGTGGMQPLGMDVADEGPINTPNPISGSRSIGDSDGNLGRSAAPMPRPANGPPNPVLGNDTPLNVSGIMAGGMGPAAKSMGRSPRPRSGRSVRRSAFFGE